MYLKRNIRFNLHKRGKEQRDGKRAIRMRLSYAGKILEFAIHRSIEEDSWDSEKQRAIVKGANRFVAIEVNQTIETVASSVNDIFARYEVVEKRAPSHEELKELLDEVLGNRSISDTIIEQMSLINVYKNFVDEVSRQNQWSKATITKHNQVIRRLQEYNSNALINSVDDKFLVGYIRYLEKEDFANVSISKHIRLIRWFLKWASANNLYAGISHNTFRPKIKGISGHNNEVIYLTTDEIKSLKEYKGKSYLEKTRDVLLFCCFTGLRYSDAITLRISDIKKEYISIVTQKTKDALLIDLNDNSKAIIERYSTNKRSNENLFAGISNQKMNMFLKELARECGINEPIRIVSYKGNQRIESVYKKWELITTHTGRRTFIVSALRLGIPSEVIMRWTGHSSYETMKPYIAIVDEMKKEQMNKFNLL